MAIMLGATAVKSIMLGSTAISRVYLGAAMVYQSDAPTTDGPYIVQTYGSTDTPDVQSATLGYNFPKPLTPGNWLIAMQGNQERFVSPGWTLLAQANNDWDGRTDTIVLAQKITEDTPQSHPGYGYVITPTWYILEIGGINPEATQLPGTFWSSQGWMFQDRAIDNAARTITADRTLFLGFQNLRGYNSGGENSMDPSYDKLPPLYSSPDGKNRLAYLVYKANQMAGTVMPPARTTGSDTQSSYCTAMITSGY